MPPLISFDIDGTLEVGDPPGLVSVEMVRECKRLGYLIGSCSDRPVSYQRQLWERLDIAADFTVLKHRLADVRLEIDAEGRQLINWVCDIETPQYQARDWNRRGRVQ